jgi:biotin synthase-related radical SAM superfamily protein
VVLGNTASEDLVFNYNIHRVKTLGEIYLESQYYLKVFGNKQGKRTDLLSDEEKSLVDKIYELVSGVVSEEHFIELFEYATEKPYSAFVIDNHKETPKENKFKINWNTIIRIN